MKKLTMLLVAITIMTISAFTSIANPKDTIVEVGVAPGQNADTVVIEATTAAAETIVEPEIVTIIVDNNIEGEPIAAYDFVRTWDEIPLDPDVQKYLYQQCKELGIDFCFALGVISVETGDTFNPNLISKTNDWGIMQVNKRSWHKTLKEMGYINSSEDLLDPCTGIHCGLFVLSEAVAQYGNCEQAYAFYNTGNPKVHSNKASRLVMQKWDYWKSVLGDVQ